MPWLKTTRESHPEFDDWYVRFVHRHCNIPHADISEEVFEKIIRHTAKVVFELGESSDITRPAWVSSFKSVVTKQVLLIQLFGPVAYQWEDGD